MGDTVAKWLNPLWDQAVGSGVIMLYYWERHLAFTVPPFTQEYIFVPANLQGNLSHAGGYLQWTSIPSERLPTPSKIQVTAAHGL